MSGFLEVREFDRITSNPDFRERSGFGFLPEKEFRALEKFAKSFSSENGDADALDFLQIGYRKGIGDTITVNNNVGVIQLPDGFQLQILPKIDLGHPDASPDTLATKKIFLAMLRSMKEFPGKTFSGADLQSTEMNLYELFIRMYIDEVRRLTKRGLKSGYVQREENLHFYKGKLQVSSQIKKNAAHKERFYMSFDEFELNRPENKLIKSTLLKLQRESKDSKNQKGIHELLPYFEDVEGSSNITKDLSLSSHGRDMQDYELLLLWSRIFLLDKGFSTFQGPDQSKAILFPMEKVFESYVARKIRSAFSSDDIDVDIQATGLYLFETPSRFALRPDILITTPEQKIILDTKWKYLKDDPEKNYGIAQGDMYQMYAYAHRYSTDEQVPAVWLLYPLNSEMRGHADITFSTDAGRVSVNVLFVDLELMTSDSAYMDEIKQKIIGQP